MDPASHLSQTVNGQVHVAKELKMLASEMHARSKILFPRKKRDAGQ